MHTDLFDAPGISADRRRALILRELAQVMGLTPAELERRLSETVARRTAAASESSSCR